jgi:DHA1 family multidrug resistance protein-like MFS transporter
MSEAIPIERPATLVAPGVRGDPGDPGAPDADGGPGPDDGRRLVRALTGAIFLQWLGASAILPLLPLYLRQQGSSYGLVGVVMAAYFAASLLAQYPAGWLADRVGRRPVLVGGLLLYAAASLGFLLPVGPGTETALRALQGVGAGSAEVAALAMVAGAVAPARRGRAFGSIYSGQLGGMAVGPLIGTLIGVGAMHLIFAGAAVAAVAAAATVLSATAVARHGRARAPADRSAGGWPRLHRSAVGAVLAGVALGLAIGVYEACWTLLLHQRGAATWQIGLSWTLYALPFALLSRPGGWLADHLDRRRLVVVTVLFTLAFCATYPWLRSVAWLVGLGAVEAIGVAVALPSIQSLLTQDAALGELGRVQGVFATAQTAAVALAALVSGAFFGLAHWAPFMGAAVLGAVMVAALPFIWAPVAGRLRPAGREPVGRDPAGPPAAGPEPGSAPG